MKFAWHNSDYKNTRFVLVGAPDESGSMSMRKGTSLAPNRIRKVSVEREVFHHGGKKSTAESISGPVKIFDYGNVKKENIQKIIRNILIDSKIPITLGGDHSITAEILGAIDKKFSILYFDAHPDFICSSKKYYGSVVCDISHLKNLDFDKSVEIGVRAPEVEELKNLKKNHIRTQSIDHENIEKNLKKIISSLGKSVYISIDMDVIDPAFAPGVSTPVPFGLYPRELLYILKNLPKSKNLIGMDIMEVNPNYDIQDTTSHLAVRLIAEIVTNWSIM